MKVSTVQNASATFVTDAREVRVFFLSIINTGTASVVGVVDIADLAGNVKFRGRITPNEGGTTTNWQRFFRFSSPLEFSGGMQVVVTGGSNFTYDIAYE